MMASFTTSAYEKAITLIPGGKIPWHTIRTAMRAEQESVTSIVEHLGIVYTAIRVGKEVTVTDVHVTDVHVTDVHVTGSKIQLFDND